MVDQVVERLVKAIRSGAIETSILERTEVYHDDWCAKAIDQEQGVCVCNPLIRIPSDEERGPEHLYVLEDGSLSAVEPQRMMSAHRN